MSSLANGDSLDDPSGHFPLVSILKDVISSETIPYWKGPNDNSGFITFDLTKMFKLKAIFFKNVSTRDLDITFSNDTVHWTYPMKTELTDVTDVGCEDIPNDRQFVGFSTRYVKLQPMTFSGSAPALRSVDFEIEEV